jgi:hypothetical protein
MRLFHKKTHTITRRMFVAKTFGLVLGIIAYLLAPIYAGDYISPYLQWGVLLWGLTFGSVIGLMGLITECPFWKHCLLYRWSTLRPILRGGFVGAWLEFMLAILLYDSIAEMALYMSWGSFVEGNLLLLAALEGFFWGAIIDYTATKIGGEGKKIL